MTRFGVYRRVDLKRTGEIPLGASVSEIMSLQTQPANQNSRLADKVDIEDQKVYTFLYALIRMRGKIKHPLMNDFQ